MLDSDHLRPAVSADSRPPLGILETATLWHVGALVIFSAWALGGNAGWSRTVVDVLACLGVLITAAGLRRRPSENGKKRFPRPFRWLWPLFLFDVLVIASLFNPNFREVTFDASTYFTRGEPPYAFLPSAARPDRALEALLFFNGVYLSCFNLVLFVRHRFALRRLLMILAINALLLAIFGTLQKLSGASALFFGASASPQRYFFSSFIYHNHWSSFTLLMVGISLGLVFHYARRPTGRDIWHSPVSLGIVAVLLLAATIPLSASRSCTILVLVFLVGAFLHWLWQLLRRRREYRQGSLFLPALGGSIAFVIALAGIYELARPVIEARMTLTAEQVSVLKEAGNFGAREVLYRDTWRMAADRPWFGWGFASYPTVFNYYNTQLWASPDGLPTYYDDAHSDWLQSFAEVGFVGTALLGLCGLVPLFRRWHVATRSPLSLYLLSGCAIILAYAWLEFPFGNTAVVIAFWTCFFSAIQYGRADSPSSRHG